MGISVEMWRARIGGFSQRNHTTFKSLILGQPNRGHYNTQCFYSLLVIMALLSIGCVEQNPGPMDENRLEKLIKDSHASLTGLINSSRKETLSAVNQLRADVNQVRADVNSLGTRLCETEKELANAVSKVSELEKANDKLAKRMEGMDASCRKNNIMIFGFSDTEDDGTDLITLVINFCEQFLSVTVTTSDLENVYRIGAKKGKRPILVKFIKFSKKQECMSNLYKLKGSKLSVSDDLTPAKRAERKILLKCAHEAKNKLYKVLIKNNGLVIDSVFVPLSSLGEAGWLDKLTPHVNIDSEEEAETIMNQGNWGLPPPQGAPKPLTRARAGSVSTPKKPKN